MFLFCIHTYLSPQFQVVISAILSLNCHQVSLTNSRLRSEAQRSNEVPSGDFKRPNGLAQQDGGALPRQVPVYHTVLKQKPLHSKNGCGGFRFVYFRMISPFSSASTTRVPPDASVPSIRRSAAGSSTALRMTRRKSRAPNLPPSAFFTSALSAAGV